MSYILYSTVVFFLALVTALYLTRGRWAHLAFEYHIPGGEYLYNRLPGSFTDDIDAGLSSSTFDLAGNVADGDGRAGLDDAAKQEILKIMKKRRMKFDQARRVYMENRFRDNGIGPDGRPKDPKFVSFS